MVLHCHVSFRGVTSPRKAGDVPQHDKIFTEKTLARMEMNGPVDPGMVIKPQGCSKVTYRNLQDGTPFHRNAPSTGKCWRRREMVLWLRNSTSESWKKSACHSVSVSAGTLSSALAKAIQSDSTTIFG